MVLFVYTHLLHNPGTNAVGSLKETAEESKETAKTIDADRSHIIDAGIVRHMKARKTMEANQLIAEVTKSLQGILSPAWRGAPALALTSHQREWGEEERGGEVHSCC